MMGTVDGHTEGGSGEVPAEPGVGWPPPPPDAGPPAIPAGARNPGRLVAGIAVAVIVVLVVVLLGLVGRTKPTAKRAGPPPVSASPTVSAPTGLTSEAQALSVTLTWNPSPGGADLYDVYRDGTQIGSAIAPTTTYTDTTVSPGNRYTFEVKAVRNDVLSDSVTTTVDTITLALSAARVEGDYDVRGKDAGHIGFSRFIPNFIGDWRFKPDCPSGACGVSWIYVGFKTYKTTLKLKGGRYSGSDFGDFREECGHTHAITVLTIKFRVVKARAIDGEWVATKLAGTLNADSPAQLGCVSTHATYKISAVPL